MALTPEEERQRALKISKLYWEPVKKRPLETQFQKSDLNWPAIIGLGISLALPFIAINVAYALYTISHYRDVASIQSSSITFVIAMMFLVLWMYGSIKNFISRIDSMISSSRATFWLMTLFLVPAIVGVQFLVMPAGEYDTASLIIHTVLYAVITVLITAVVMALLTYILDFIEASDSKKIKLAFGFTAIPYVIGAIITLFRLI